MGDRKTGLVLSVIFVLILFPFVAEDVFAIDYKKHVTAEDLGVLQLAAHDLFNVDRCIGQPCTPVDHEDGRLNLSTLFVDTTTVSDEPFDIEDIARGGEPRNRENIMVFTIASYFGLTYEKLLEDHDPHEAKNIVVQLYHEKLADTYQKTFGEQFPIRNNSPTSQTALDQQNLALRTIHDFLPGKIKINNKFVSTLDPYLIDKKLSQKELKQKSSKLDGKFDDEFRHIDICIPNGPCIEVDLLEADRSFGIQFGTSDDFNSFLAELEDGLYDDDDSVMIHIRTLIGKGQNFDPYS